MEWLNCCLIGKSFWMNVTRNKVIGFLEIRIVQFVEILDSIDILSCCCSESFECKNIISR